MDREPANWKIQRDVGKVDGAVWILGQKGVRGVGHKLRECQVLDGVLKKPYVRVREKLRYDAKSCCYVCSWPGD